MLSIELRKIVPGQEETEEIYDAPGTATNDFHAHLEAQHWANEHGYTVGLYIISGGEIVHGGDFEPGEDE